MGTFQYRPKGPKDFEKAMVFIDGSNLFPRLTEKQVKLSSLYNIAAHVCSPRQLHRVYLYTCQEKIEVAYEQHGKEAFQGCRIVLGTSVVSEKKGKISHREKGVDALLVADLIYHAAQKNCQYAVVLSNDLDFSFALKRVEDFGCRTAVLSLIDKAPEKLVQSADYDNYFSVENMLANGWCTQL